MPAHYLRLQFLREITLGLMLPASSLACIALKLQSAVATAAAAAAAATAAAVAVAAATMKAATGRWRPSWRGREEINLDV